MKTIFAVDSEMYCLPTFVNKTIAIKKAMANATPAILFKIIPKRYVYFPNHCIIALDFSRTTMKTKFHEVECICTYGDFGFFMRLFPDRI